MKLAQLLDAHKNELAITPRHERWLAQNPNATYSDDAKAFLAEELGKPQRDRTKSFSASGAGTCMRKRQFEFLGLPRRPFRTSLIQVFHNGTYVHLRWQAAGLTEGWLKQAEVPVEAPHRLLKGTMDGVLFNDAGLEIKSINSNGFRNVMQHGGKREHLYQIASYVLADGPPNWVLLYEDKDTNEYKEINFTPPAELIIKVATEQDKLVDATMHEQLVEMKDECWAKKGTEYIQCQFRDICPLMKSWTQAKEAGCESSEPRTLRLRPTSSLPSE
jgi:hypothetical protein